MPSPSGDGIIIKAYINNTSFLLMGKKDVFICFLIKKLSL